MNATNAQGFLIRSVRSHMTSIRKWSTMCYITPKHVHRRYEAHNLHALACREKVFPGFSTILGWMGLRRAKKDSESSKTYVNWLFREVGRGRSQQLVCVCAHVCTLTPPSSTRPMPDRWSAPATICNDQKCGVVPKQLFNGIFMTQSDLRSLEWD